LTKLLERIRALEQQVAKLAMDSSTAPDGELDSNSKSEADGDSEG
jgi:hypothetical protein